MKLEDLNPDLQEKVEACDSAEELMELAEAEGLELSDKDLDAIAGGVKNKKIRIRPRLFKKTKPQPAPAPVPVPETQTYPDSVLPTVDPLAETGTGAE